MNVNIEPGDKMKLAERVELLQNAENYVPDTITFNIHSLQDSVRAQEIKNKNKYFDRNKRQNNIHNFLELDVFIIDYFFYNGEILFLINLLDKFGKIFHVKTS